jgi:hypothetical protein
MHSPSLAKQSAAQDQLGYEPSSIIIIILVVVASAPFGSSPLPI